MNYTQFAQYTPSDAFPGTAYWISKEGADWRVIKELIAQDQNLTGLVYNSTGKIEFVGRNLDGVIPTVKSILIVDLTTLLIEGDIQSHYLIKGGQLERLNLEKFTRKSGIRSKRSALLKWAMAYFCRVSVNGFTRTQTASNRSIQWLRPMSSGCTKSQLGKLWTTPTSS